MAAEKRVADSPGLLGAGPSLVGVDGAMRVRDVSRPRPENESGPQHETAPSDQATRSARGRQAARHGRQPSHRGPAPSRTTD